MEWILSIDNSILNWIQENLRSPFGDVLMKIFTMLGDAGILWIALGLVLTCIRKTRRAGITMLGALVLNLLVCNIIIKPLVGRVRPFEANGFTDLLVKAPTDPSFPSGHTSASFAAASALFCYYKKWGIGALILAAVISFSRLYLYVHYPSDVFVGLLIGVASAAAVYFMMRQYLAKKSAPKLQ